MFAMQMETIMIVSLLMILLLAVIKILDNKRRRALEYCRKMIDFFEFESGTEDAPAKADKVERTMLLYGILPSEVGVSSALDLHWKALRAHHYLLKTNMVNHRGLMRTSMSSDASKQSSKVAINGCLAEYRRHRGAFERRFGKTLQVVDRLPRLVDLR
jgi:hypothetical protein